MSDQEFQAALLKRMEVQIALNLRFSQIGGRKLSSREQIAILSELGLRPIDIANILGRKAAYINKELFSIRKGSKEN